jgi:5-methylcytosine-specific restriction endonuclease McrA
MTRINGPPAPLSTRVFRRPGTDIDGQPFTEAIIQAVWSKGRTIAGYNPDAWRYDRCGQPMRRSEHGNPRSEHGWEIDHIRPVVLGGLDVPANLQPLHWRNNRKKSDFYPWYCP